MDFGIGAGKPTFVGLSDGDFIDFVHFTDQGATAVATAIADI